MNSSREGNLYKKYSLSSASLDEVDGFKVKTMSEAFDSPGFRAGELHTHDFYTVFWFTEGEGTHTVDFQCYDICPNTVIFLAPGQIHSFNSPTDQKGYIVEFSSDFIADERNQESVFMKYSSFYSSCPCHKISDKDAVFIRNLVDAMYYEKTQKDRFAHSLFLGMLVNLFLITLHRAEPGSSAESVNLVSPATKTYVRYRHAIEDNFQRLHTVKDYAALLGISARSISSAVSQMESISPLQMINNRIILEAKRLLRYSDMIIKEISYDLGFDDPSYFVKFFKRETGLLPKEYRDNGTFSGR